MQNTIPLVDLKKQYAQLKAEMNTAIQEVIEETAFIGDPGNRFLASFEISFAQYIGTQHCIGCANGTDSIEILLSALGIGVGDEVMVPAITWISTASAVVSVGAIPVFIDVDPTSYTLNPSLVEQRITSRTKAIIPVHLYGNMADMPSLMSIAAKHGLSVIEDCAQSHGAIMDGKKAGNWGHAASFSFYPGKNLGAYGDAGCITTSDPKIAHQCRTIANHGQLGKHNHQLIGRNSKLDGIQAAILGVKLKYLDEWIQARNLIAQWYSQYLDPSLFILPQPRPHSQHAYHLYVVQTAERDKLLEGLKAQGIHAGVHYPVSLPLLPAFKHLNYEPKDCPVASSLQARIISLPMYPELTEQEVIHIAHTAHTILS